MRLLPISRLSVLNAAGGPSLPSAAHCKPRNCTITGRICLHALAFFQCYHASVLAVICLKFQSHAKRLKQHAELTFEGEPGRARAEAAPTDALLPAGDDRCKVCS